MCGQMQLLAHCAKWGKVKHYFWPFVASNRKLLGLQMPFLSQSSSSRMSCYIFQKLTNAQVWQEVCKATDLLLAWKSVTWGKYSSGYGLGCRKPKKNVTYKLMRKSQTNYNIMTFLVPIRAVVTRQPREVNSPK